MNLNDFFELIPHLEIIILNMVSAKVSIFDLTCIDFVSDVHIINIIIVYTG